MLELLVVMSHCLLLYFKTAVVNRMSGECFVRFPSYSMVAAFKASASASKVVPTCSLSIWELVVGGLP